MMETLYIFKSGPLEWMARKADHADSLRRVVMGSSREDALQRWQGLWGPTEQMTIVDGPPPRLNKDSSVERALALGRCYERWTQRLEVSARAGMVELLSAAAALDELYALATK
jgi:hypothetical protein